MNFIEAVEEAKKGNTIVCNNTLEFKWEDDTLVTVGELIASTKMIPLDLVLSDQWEVREGLTQLLDRLVVEAKELGVMVAHLQARAGQSCAMLHDDMDKVRDSIDDIKKKILEISGGK